MTHTTGLRQHAPDHPPTPAGWWRKIRRSVAMGTALALTLGTVVALGVGSDARPAQAAEDDRLLFGCSASGFETDNQGWRVASVWNNDGVSIKDAVRPSGWTATDGLPPGSLRNPDLSGSSFTEIWTPEFTANGFDSDYSDVIGRSLSFDYKEETIRPINERKNGRYMGIVGANGTRYWTPYNDQLVSGNYGWQPVSVLMDPSVWTSVPPIDTGAAAVTNWTRTGVIDPTTSPSMEDFEAALADLDRFVFAIEYSAAIYNEVALFDNFGVDCQVDITKTSDATENSRVGDTINYTVTATNTGSGDYSETTPARIVDDLTGVLDDADYQNDASADREGTLEYTSPRLSWEGPLAVGDSVTLTYSAILKAGGDRTVTNVAFVGDPENPAAETPTCDPNSTQVACVEYQLPRLEISKVASRGSLPAIGDEVDYTVTVRNPGPGIYTAEAPASMSDDLSAVLDDATLVGAPSVSTGSATVSGNTLTWDGPLAAGQSATITYTVRYTGAGDQILRNIACVPTADALAEPCAEVQIPGSKLTVSKSDAPSDTPLRAGSTVVYTLWFDNPGQAAATVDHTDFLDFVLDDADVTVEPAAGRGALTAVRTGSHIRITGEVAGGDRASVTYTVKVKADGERGDNLLVNHLLGGTPENPSNPNEPDEPVDPPTPPGPEDVCVHTTTSTCNPVGQLRYEKSVAFDTPLGTGSVLTYTVKAINEGRATESVAREDVLTDVLDDATVSQQPTSDIASVTATEISEQRFAISGELAPGVTATITYQVTLKADGSRGNNQADNYLVAPSGDPENPTEPPAACEPGSTECTSTPIAELATVKTVDPASGTPVIAGQELEYTLAFTNSGKIAADLSKVDNLTHLLDDADLITEPVSSSDTVAVSRDAQIISISGSVAAGETVTVTYTVKVRDAAERGDNVLANFVMTPGTPVPADPVCAVDSLDCTQNPVGVIVATKTVDPKTGTSVRAGDTLTYTLRFENTGAGAADIDYVDDLAGVLDDTDLVDGSLTSAGLTTSLNGTELAVTGTLEPGAVGTVTYAVTVKPYGQQKDHTILNFLLPSGDEPPAACATTNPLCTENPVAPTPPGPTAPGLSVTGGPALGLTAGAAVLLLLAGVTTILVVRRKTADAGATASE